MWQLYFFPLSLVQPDFLAKYKAKIFGKRLKDAMYEASSRLREFEGNPVLGLYALRLQAPDAHYYNYRVNHEGLTARERCTMELLDGLEL